MKFPKNMKVMTKGQIEKFAVGYPYPTDFVEILLIKYGFDTVKVHEILCKPYMEVVKEVVKTKAVERICK